MGWLMGERVQARAMVVVIGFLIVACAGGEGAVDGPAVASDAAAATPPAPSARVREGELAEVLIVEGWDPYPVFADGFSPWVDGAAMEVMDWLEHLLPARPAPAGATRIDIDVAVERERAPCFAFHRPVTAVRVDVPGRAATAIGERLLAEAAGASALIDDYRWKPGESPEDAAWCEERFGGELVGFHIVEVHTEVCDLPGGPELVCTTVGRFGYHLGARVLWFGDTFVFDASTGEVLDRGRLLAPYDPVLLEDFFARIWAEVPVDVPHLAEQGVVASDLDLLPMSEDADVVPTLEGMRWHWSPYRHVTGSIDVIVPWDVLDTFRVR